MDYWTAFILGLVGSLHCAGMCGPLALALPQTNQSAGAYLLGRFGYNFGRIVSYGLLGMGFGFLGRTLLLAGFQRWISIGLGMALLAGLLLSRRLAAWFPIAGLVAWLKTGMGSMLRRRSVSALAMLGLLNGLLPCGLVYVAGAGAAATGHLASGMAYMVVFGMGTIPMMLAISLSGRLVPLSLRLKLQKAVPVAVILLATLLILRGMGLGIPYLSPNLSGPAGAADCCH